MCVRLRIQVIAGTKQRFLEKKQKNVGTNYVDLRTYCAYDSSTRQKIDFELKGGILSLKPPGKHLLSKYGNAPNKPILRFYKKSKNMPRVVFGEETKTGHGFESGH